MHPPFPTPWLKKSSKMATRFYARSEAVVHQKVRSPMWRIKCEWKIIRVLVLPGIIFTLLFYVLWWLPIRAAAALHRFFSFPFLDKAELSTFFPCHFFFFLTLLPSRIFASHPTALGRGLHTSQFQLRIKLLHVIRSERSLVPFLFYTNGSASTLLTAARR